MEPEYLAILRDEKKSIVERLRAAVKLEVEYWDDPNKSPPNLGQAEFYKVLGFIPKGVAPRWEERTSHQGSHGRTGEDQVFNLNFAINRGRSTVHYYLKGFFFEKNNLKGVCIQSFRIERIVSRQRLRVV